MASILRIIAGNPAKGENRPRSVDSDACDPETLETLDIYGYDMDKMGFEPKGMPFDVKRMVYGGFQVMVDA
jgi:uncharacterized protein YbaA (DUF1428 family)